jgi:hypothetical protein
MADCEVSVRRTRKADASNGRGLSRKIALRSAMLISDDANGGAEITFLVRVCVRYSQ